MAGLGATNPTLLDQIKATAPDGAIADVVEALTENNPILMDATAMEGNLPTGHRVTVRSGLPTLAWRMYNEGVAASKSTTIQVDESCGMLNGRSNLDCSLARLNGNEAEFRALQDKGFLQKFNNQMAAALFYSNIEQNPEQMQGLLPRFNTLGLSQVVNYAGISSDAASGAEQSSIWFVTWSTDGCYLIYPKGSSAGLTRTDMGKQLVTDGTNDFLAWVTDFEWQIGLAVQDWRNIVRVCNIDSSTMATDETWIEIAMIEGYNRIHDLNAGRTICYMSRQVKTWLERQVAVKGTMNYTPTDWHGKTIQSFRGIPIVTCDALTVTEAVVA